MSCNSILVCDIGIVIVWEISLIRRSLPAVIVENLFLLHSYMSISFSLYSIITLILLFLRFSGSMSTSLWSFRWSKLRRVIWVLVGSVFFCLLYHIVWCWQTSNYRFVTTTLILRYIAWRFLGMLSSPMNLYFLLSIWWIPIIVEIFGH